MVPALRAWRHCTARPGFRGALAPEVFSGCPTRCPSRHRRQTAGNAADNCMVDGRQTCNQVNTISACHNKTWDLLFSLTPPVRRPGPRGPRASCQPGDAARRIRLRSATLQLTQRASALHATSGYCALFAHIRFRGVSHQRSAARRRNNGTCLTDRFPHRFRRIQTRSHTRWPTPADMLLPHRGGIRGGIVGVARFQTRPTRAATCGLDQAGRDGQPGNSGTESRDRSTGRKRATPPSEPDVMAYGVACCLARQGNT